MTLQRTEISQRRTGRIRVNQETGEVEKECLKCGEWWPMTDEFFSRGSGTRNLKSPCKACNAEKRYATNAEAACCVPGCERPRHRCRNGELRYSRCTLHFNEYHRNYHLSKKEGKRDDT